MYNTSLYLIRAVTNLHAGAGDASFGLIDKLVQRDVVTDLPTIHASSIKGSLRQLYSADELPNETEIFGSDNRLGAAGKLQQGQFLFYDAKLLALPVRSSHDLYFMATTPPLIQDFLRDCERFGLQLPEVDALRQLSKQPVEKERPLYFGEQRSGMVYLEDLAAEHGALADAAKLKPYYGPRLALLHVDDFAERCEELPTVARNSLNNGISENLWYEEIVPRETRFYCPISYPENTKDLLGATLNAQYDGLVQLGANATVGYGLCEWTRLTSTPTKANHEATV